MVNKDKLSLEPKVVISYIISQGDIQDLAVLKDPNVPFCMKTAPFIISLNALKVESKQLTLLNDLRYADAYKDWPERDSFLKRKRGRIYKILFIII